MTATPEPDAAIAHPFLETLIGAAAGFRDADLESVDVSGEARELRTWYAADAAIKLDQHVRSYVGGNFGRDPDNFEMDELIRLAYYDSVLAFVLRRYGARPIAIRNELLRVGALRHYEFPDGDDCPTCYRRARSQ